MNDVRFVDTTLRDGQQSLWAYGMRTGMMLPVAAQMDQAGFEAIELGGPVELNKCVRELRENPWDRYRLLVAQIRKTPLRLIHGTRSGFAIYPHAVHQLHDQCIAAIGLKQVRISDSWNDSADWQWRVKQARKAGLEPIINLIYTVSPRHTDEYYAQKAREAIRLNVFRLCLKDPGGLLTPERTKTLVPAVLNAANATPVELHTHCTTGLGSLCCLEAIQRGMNSINTAIPPLADGSSNPSIFNVAANARAMGYQPIVDEEPIRPVAKHFTTIAKQENLPIGETPEYDYAQYVHQIPGGMISNLRYQLRRVGMEDKIEQTLEEAVRVRAEFGYPIMVTPLSQFVGSQAAINVIVGERYKEVTDQVIKFALGHAGAEGARDMDPNVKEKILDRPRAKEWAKWQPDEPTADEMRRRLGAEGTSDEELLLRWIVGREDIEAMRANPRPLEYLNSEQPLVNLLQQLSKRTNNRQIHVQTPGFSVTLERR